MHSLDVLYTRAIQLLLLCIIQLSIVCGVAIVKRRMGKSRIRKTTEGFVVRQCYSRIDKRTERIVYSFVCDRRTAIDKVFLFPAKCNCIFCCCCCSYFHIELIQMNSKRITLFCRKICFQKYSNWNVCGGCALAEWYYITTYCSMSMSIVVGATHSPELCLAIVQNRFANRKKISFVNVRVFMPEINFTRRNVAHEKSFRSLEILREWFHRVVHRQRDVIANWNCPSVCVSNGTKTKFMI